MKRFLRKIPLLLPVVTFIRNKYCLISVFLTGHQHYLHNFIYYKFLTSKRSKSFKVYGFKKINLLTPKEWKSFSFVVNEIYNQGSFKKDTLAEGHINLREYINMDNKKIKKHVEKLLVSKSFNLNLKNIFRKDFVVCGVQIWRNRAESFSSNIDLEVNSSFYHLDNGNHGKNRSLINIFMYLSEVNHDNGPFTFFTPEQTKLINRKFKPKTLTGLRTRKLTKQIEDFVTPEILITKPGQALIIDNQICMHRAGYCKSGNRDIIEILCRES